MLTQKIINESVETDNVLRSEIDSDEQLIWSGKPQQGILFRSSDIFMIPFSLLWGGFAIFWEVMAITSTRKTPNSVDNVFSLFGIPFVLVGLYMIFGRFIVEAIQRNKTYYGITNQRVIIVSDLIGKRVKSLNLRTLSDVSLIEKSNGKGNITFGQDSIWSTWFNMGAMPGIGVPQTPRFEMIDNAKDVYNKLREEIKKS
ncbi:MAG: hypothetical protein HZA77_00770 [Candidatus Schekmanbacteria bacterium]|nr:hypothetical protein [Candidatus Schekmanbacteria bacterium]